MNNAALFMVIAVGLVLLSGLAGGGPPEAHVSFAFRNLPDLPEGFTYESWVVNAQGEVISLGRFRRPGDAVDQTFKGNLHRQRALLISVETGDPDGTGDLNGPEPDLVLLAGAIRLRPRQDRVPLSLIGGGVFLLQTPTDDSAHDRDRAKLKRGLRFNDENDEQGIWFIAITPDPGRGRGQGPLPEPGLDLPGVPSLDFVYEGWVVRGETFLSTGRFLDPTRPDFNAAQSPYDGGRVYLGPPYPGEDFVHTGMAADGLELPLTLNDGTWSVWISIEPQADTAPVPFALVPWKAPIAPETACLYRTISAQPSPRDYQEQRCALEAQYAGVAVIR